MPKKLKYLHRREGGGNAGGGQGAGRVLFFMIRRKIEETQ